MTPKATVLCQIMRNNGSWLYKVGQGHRSKGRMRLSYYILYTYIFSHHFQITAACWSNYLFQQGCLST